jgi:S1-C subfamily serine protease
VRRGAIGVIPETVTEVLAAALGLTHHDGVILSDVAPHSAAEAAGLQPGDVVVAANGNPVRESRQFMAAMFQRAVGDEVVFDVERGGQRMKMTVTIMERPSAPRELTQLANEEGQMIRRLGVIALNLDPKVAATLGDLRRLSGVVIAAIPLEYAGLNPGLTSGDVIYEFNGSRVASVDDLRKAMGAKESGAPIALLVERNEQLVYVSFELE